MYPGRRRAAVRAEQITAKNYPRRSCSTEAASTEVFDAV
jgi:hypothetical protein